MQDITVPAQSLQGIVITSVIGIMFPILATITLKVKTRCKISSFLWGFLAYLVFSFLLMALFNGLVNHATDGALTQNPVIYGMFYGLSAACFAECGRFYVMKFLMRGKVDKKNALMFGMGFGGTESILLTGANYFTYMFVAFSANYGELTNILNKMEEPERTETFEQIRFLWESESIAFYMAGVKCIAMLFIHICLSYLIYRSIKYNDYRMMVLALAIHFLIEATIIMIGQVVDVLSLTIGLVVVAVAFVVFTFKLYEKEEENVNTGTNK